MRKEGLATLSYLMLSGAVFAGDMTMQMAGQIVIDAPLVREVAVGQPVTAGYMTLTNNGGTDDTLVSATANFSDRVELHEMAMDGDTMKMREVVDGIVVPAGETVEFAPGGLHIMIFAPTESLEAGKSYDMQLTFEGAGAVTVSFTGATMKTLMEKRKKMKMDHSGHEMSADG